MAFRFVGDKSHTTTIQISTTSIYSLSRRVGLGIRIPRTKGKRPYWAGTLLKNHIQPTAIKAGLPKIGWHSFRHGVSAYAKEAGLQPQEAKALLRHEMSALPLTSMES